MSHLSRSAVLTAAWMVLGSGCALASGFQLREQSPSAQGLSFAGITAGGDDIGGMFFNAASLTRFEGHQAVLGVSLVSPSTELLNGSATRASVFPAPVRTISGSTTHGNPASLAALPNFYAMWSLAPDLKVGLGLNAPYGMTTEYDRAWIGRYHALKSSLTTLDLTPTLAYRFSPAFSMGLSAVARYSKAELTNAVDFGAIGAAKQIPGFVPGGMDGHAEVKGQAWAYGYKVGLLLEPGDFFRLGVSYHSSMSPTLKGDAHYTGVPTLLSSVFAASSVKATMDLPDNLSLGLAWDLGSEFTLATEICRTGWSRFQELRIRFASGQPDALTIEKWKDTWYFALGGTWRPSREWTFRSGVAVDQTPVSDETRTPRIPDAQRTWLSLGLGYALNQTWSLDLGYSHIFTKDSTVGLQAGQPGNPDFFRGSLQGTYKNRIDILALQLKMSF